MKHAIFSGYLQKTACTKVRVPCISTNMKHVRTFPHCNIW